MVSLAKLQKNLLREGDFCRITTEVLQEFGIDKGTNVAIVSHKIVPISKEDLYTQRIKFVVQPLDKEGHLVLKKLYMVDPNSLHRLSKHFQKKFLKIMEEDFSKKVEEDDTIN